MEHYYSTLAWRASSCRLNLLFLNLRRKSCGFRFPARCQHGLSLPGRGNCLRMAIRKYSVQIGEKLGNSKFLNDHGNVHSNSMQENESVSDETATLITNFGTNSDSPRRTTVMEATPSVAANSQPDGEGSVQNVHNELANLTAISLQQSNKIKELQDKLLRAFAEIENNRQRHIRELDNARIYSITSFAKSVVEVADNLTLATSAINQEILDANEELKKIYEGIKITENVLMETLRKFGITKYYPIGEVFDPKFHEALFEIDDSMKPKGQIAQVIQSGYKIQDRILRAAKVGVVRG